MVSPSDSTSSLPETTVCIRRLVSLYLRTPRATPLGRVLSEWMANNRRRGSQTPCDPQTARARLTRLLDRYLERAAHTSCSRPRLLDTRRLTTETAIEGSL
jgi:hypothetical protein